MRRKFVKKTFFTCSLDIHLIYCRKAPFQIRELKFVWFGRLRRKGREIPDPPHGQFCSTLVLGQPPMKKSSLFTVDLNRGSILMRPKFVC